MKMNKKQYNNVIENTLKHEQTDDSLSAVRAIFDNMGVALPQGDITKLKYLAICLDGLWGNQIDVKSYSKVGNDYSGVLEFTLYDHFGLDAAELKEDINVREKICKKFWYSYCCMCVCRNCFVYYHSHFFYIYFKMEI